MAEKPEKSGHPSLLLGAGHLAALWALAFVQPLFDLLGRNPDFFVARGNTSSDILIFSFVFTLVPPLLMLGLEALARLIGERVRWAIHLGLLGLLTAALALQIEKHLISRPAGVMIAVAIAIGAGAVYLYTHGRFLRSLLDVLIPAPVVVLALFLLFSGASELVLPQTSAKAVDVSIAHPAPVVMIVFDEFPEGSLMTPDRRIDASRFPAFAELARHSTWFRDATTVAGFTPRAVPAILSGRRPSEDELPTSSDQPHSLFTLLGRSYEMRVMEQVTHLCPESLCPDEGKETPEGTRLRSLFDDLKVVSEHLLLPDALRQGLPDISQTFGDFATVTQSAPGKTHRTDNNARQLVADLAATGTTDESIRMEQFASKLTRGESRVVNMIHLQKPHYPWTHLPNGQTYSNLESEWLPFFTGYSTWAAPQPVVDIAFQRHMLEVGYTDHLLGEAIKRLKRTGLWNRALIVVTADHGNAVIAHQPRRNPSQANIGQIAPVPLFIKAPGQADGRIIDRHTCTTDVLPEIAWNLGIDYPWKRFPCPPGTVTVVNSPSGETTASLARVEALRQAYIDRIHRLFGGGHGWEGVYRYGPNPELIGRSPSRFPVAPPGGASAEIDQAGRLDDVHPRGEEVLASDMRGSISGAQAGESLAVAVNGRIAAVGRSFDEDGTTHFSMLVPPRYFRRGQNQAVIYLVHGAGRSVTLESLGPG